MLDAFPIVAIATAPGRGGIGVVRLSGKDLTPIIKNLFPQVLQPRHAHYLPFNDANGEAIDAGIVLYFPGPNSYTGEDVLELQGHGGPAVLKRLVARCLEAGRAENLRHAQPGEFTQRAFLNNRLDLAQAEAVADLIEASSETAARSAMSSLSGKFSEEINGLSERIVHLRMLVEATLDFPEEEIDFLEKYQAADTLASIQSDLNKIITQAQQGRIMREGLYVVLAGQPNVGKSSLLNALAGDEVAIVTDIAGTTRDRVTQQIHLDGVPLHIIDTAGLRETEDQVESIGIARSWQEIDKADVIIHLHDAQKPVDELHSAITQRLPKNTPILEVFNKIDLVVSVSLPVANTNLSNVAATLYISAKTGQGLEELRHTLLEVAGYQTSTESPWLARERHVNALEQAKQHLELAEQHAQHDDQVLDLFAEELRLAHESLCHITGEFTSDDLLGEIFSSFCIGK